MRKLLLALELLFFAVKVVSFLVLHLIFSLGMYVTLLFVTGLIPCGFVRFLLNLLPFTQDYSLFGYSQNVLAYAFCWVVCLPYLVYIHWRLIIPILIAHPIISFQSLNNEFKEILG
jgi:hypothetical protein